MADRHSLLLVSGIAKVTARVESGDPLLIAFTAAGDTVGEMAALDGAPRSATVTACGPLTARALHPGVLRDLLMRRPEVAAALTAMARVCCESGSCSLMIICRRTWGSDERPVGPA
ncbi:Crp/Fnr family transcriptional regulator [Streptomyces olivaceoviridis]|uniref:Crp/Fnr family transcriptional regulator n=1 Tax=Streptomyces olivaceoviridis TaxID=1921 RepID=UPI0036BDDF10